MTNTNGFRNSMMVLIMVLPSMLYSQYTRSIALDVEAGAALITSKQVKNVYGPGMKLLAGPKIGLNADNTLWLRIHGGFQWHFKEIEEQNSITDHLRIWKAGTQIQYFLSQGKVNFAGYAGVNYNWCANYFSATHSYNPWTNNSQTVNSDKFLKGNGISADVGAIVSFKKLYIKLGYEYFNPDLTVNPEIVKSANDAGFIVPSKYKYNLSSMSLSIGYSLNLSK